MDNRLFHEYAIDRFVAAIAPLPASTPYHYRLPMLTAALDRLEAIGAFALGYLRAFGDTLYLFSNTAAGLLQLRGGKGFYLRQTVIQQLYFTAVQAFWLVSLVGVAMGVMAVLPLLAFGVSAVDLQARILKVVMFHQLIPFLTALIVVGRSGTVITAELGHMQSNAVIDSLVAMGIEPHRFLLLPRMIAITCSLLLLTLWGNCGAVLGAALFNHFKGAAGFINFMEACAKAVGPIDALITALMSVSYGIAIALVSGYFGLKSRSMVDVQRHLSPAFVSAFIACIAITALFSLIRT